MSYSHLMSNLPSYWIVWLAVLLFGTVLCLERFTTWTRRLPPGPRPSFIIGNALQIPLERPEYMFKHWGTLYGDVVHLRVFSQPMIVLNSLEAAKELLDRRARIYSDRPRFVLFSELMGWHNASTHVRYGERFRKHRRFIHQTFNQRASRELAPVQHEEAATLIQDLVSTPDAFVDHIRRYSAASILKITYGVEVHSADDLFVRLAERAGKLTVQSGTPAASMVDYFPSMRHIPVWAPFSGFKRNANEVKAAVDLMMNVPYEHVKQQLLQGTAAPSLTARLIEEHRAQGIFDREAEEDIKGVAGTLYAAAEDTSVCVITSFILAMTLHPEIQARAQDEMDRVLGRLEIPDAEDRIRLPYVESLVKEVYRWNPPVPLGLPHRCMENDVYRDHLIPEGSTILANIYAILKDCPDPDTFSPQRYMDGSDLFDPRDVVFGFGRRKCPGKYYGDHGVWMAIVMMLARVTIRKARDSDGALLHPEVDFQSGFVRHPKIFKCEIILRR